MRESTLAHLYGVPATILGLIGAWFLIRQDSPWQEYALVSSGWLASAIYAGMLVRANAMARQDGEAIGTLKERVAGLERTMKEQVAQLEQTVAQRSATLDFIAGLHIGQKATPRAIPEGGGEND